MEMKKTNTIEFLASDKIIDNNEKKASIRIRKKQGATHYRIYKRRFFQFRINSFSTESGNGMKEIPFEIGYIQIQAEGHMHHVDYNVSFD